MRSLLANLRSARVRAVLALGVFFLFASAGTLAYWTAQATVPGAVFQTGNFDLQVNGADNLSWAGLNDARLAPGESVAFHVTLRNAGTPGLTWTAKGRSTGPLDSLRYQLYVGGVASNSGLPTTVNRAGSCSGTTAQGTPVALTDAATMLTSAAQNLARDASVNVCLRISLPTDVETQQGQSASPVFTFDAKQVAK